MRWKKQKLESLASDEPYSFIGGPFGSKLTMRDYQEEGIPVIRGSNMNNGRFLDMSDFVFVSDSKVREDLSSNLAKPGDLIFTQRGTLGQVALIPDKGISDRYVVSQSQMKLTVDENKANRLFLYYYLSSHEAIERIQSFISSSGVPHINLTVMRNFEVPVPPIQTQHAIASILSSYDDLIENNLQRIQLLEQAAQLFYKEWFVHLRFPGHEYTKTTNSLPEGWETGTIVDIGEVVTGKTPSKQRDSFYGNDVPFIKTPDMHGNIIVIDTEEYLSTEGANSQSNKTLPPRSILVSCIGTVGVVAFNATIAQTNQQINAIIPKSESLRYWTFFMAKDLQPLLEGIGGGVTMPNVNKSKFSSIHVVIPSQKVLDQFNLIVAPNINLIERLELMNKLLKQARDFLQPRLMNGEVPV
jgi:type I restriction enzyme S subunit